MLPSFHAFAAVQTGGLDKQIGLGKIRTVAIPLFPSRSIELRYYGGGWDVSWMIEFKEGTLVIEHFGIKVPIKPIQYDGMFLPPNILIGLP